MQALQSKIRKSLQIHEACARIVSGRMLKCRVCGSSGMPTEEQLRDYFRNGWPICCGETVELVVCGDDKLPS